MSEDKPSATPKTRKHGGANKGRSAKSYPPTKAERAARKRNDMSTWRQELIATKITFDDERKAIYLQHLAETDRRGHAAKAAGVSLETVRKHRMNDPVFDEACIQARQEYADNLQKEVRELMKGWNKPMLGGQFKDEIIANERIIPLPLLQMEMKRAIPEYREGAGRGDDGAVEKGVGVIVVPAEASYEGWTEAAAKLKQKLEAIPTEVKQ